MKAVILVWPRQYFVAMLFSFASLGVRLAIAYYGCLHTVKGPFAFVIVNLSNMCMAAWRVE